MPFSPSRSTGFIFVLLLMACAGEQSVAPRARIVLGQQVVETQPSTAVTTDRTLLLVPFDTIPFAINKSRGRRQLIRWRSTDSSVVTISPDGDVIARSPGTAQVIESNLTVEKRTTVKVSRGVAQLEATPASVILRVGEAKPLAIIARSADGELLSFQQGKFVSLDTSVAAVTVAGGLIGIRVGTTTIRAIRGGSSVGVSVTVAGGPGVDPALPPPTSPTVATFAISPKTASVSHSGTLQFSATARTAGGGVLAVSVSYLATGGTVSMGGLFTAGPATGLFMVIANCGCGKADTARVSVASVVTTPPTLTSIAIVPKTAQMAPGSTWQYLAKVLWSNGDTTSVPIEYATSGGTITPSGSFEAPALPGTYYVVARQQGGTLADTSTVTVLAPGVLLSHGFDNGTMGDLWKWGTPRVVTDPTATGGRSVQVDWASHPGRDGDQGIGYSIPILTRKLHLRFRYKQDALANNTGIKKTVRFRGDNNAALGTFNIQWGSFLFYGDNYTVTPWNIWPTGRATNDSSFVNNLPDSFRGRWRYIEVMVDYTVAGRVKAGLWVDGTQIINYDAALDKVLPANFALKQAWMASVFNDPAGTQTDWFDSVVVSTSYIGVP